MNLEKILQEFGLKEKHARVYLACLELGSASVLQISRKADIPRSTCEVVLGALQQKGFVSSFRKKRAKHFSAEDPRSVVAAAKDKAARLERALPQFLNVYGQSKTAPTVRFYPGKQGMRTVLEEILTEARFEATELLSFSSVDDLFDLLGEDFQEFVKKRVARKLPSRVILRDSEKARERLRLARQELRQVRFIPSAYEHHGLVFTWGRKVAMCSLQKEFNVLVIESDVLARTVRMLFESLWDHLPNVS